MSFTIKDISKLANVSTSTVSRILNGKTDRVSEGTVKRVLEITKANNYRPNKIAKGLVTRQTNTIGLILPDITNPFFPELARGMEDGALVWGYNTFLCNTDDQFQKEEQYIQALEQRCIDGIVFAAGAIGRQDHICELSKEDIPVVMIDRMISGDHFSRVCFDNEKGGYLAARHLLDLGHRKIGCITGPALFQNDVERVNGFKRAFREAGVKIDDGSIVQSDYKIESGEKSAYQILKKNRVTAILANNDLMAVGVYEAARKLKLRMPQDLSVVGFDDIFMTRYMQPKLTTIRQPAYEMGFKASQMLIQIIKGQRARGTSVIFEPELMVRESTAQQI